MNILPIYLYGHEILRKRAKPVRAVTDDMVRLIAGMHRTMVYAQGIGLAANQIGDLNRIIVVNLSDVEGMEHLKPMTFINPEIVDKGGSLRMEEGCLSIPELRDEVERVEHITLLYRDTNFNENQLEAGGLLARVILHEIDHLDGVLFFDYLSKEKRAAHEELLLKIRNGDVDVGYPVVSTRTVAA